MARRTSALLAVAATATLTLSACGSSTNAAGGSPSDPTSPVTITMWGTYGNGGNSAQTDMLNNTIIPAFEKLHPTITVKYVDMPYASLQQKLTTGAAAGQLPDLIRADIGWVPKFGALGVLAPLDQVLPNFAALSADNYPGILATNKYNGHYYGLPLDTNTRVLISNSDVYKKAGINPPTTFDEFKADAAKLKAAGASAFADSGLQGWNIYPWIWSNGGQVTSPDLTKASGYLDGPKSVEAVQMLVDMYKAGEIPNLIIGNSGAVQTQDGLPKGTYASILDGPWMAAIWQQQYPNFKPVYTPMPSGEGGSVSVVGGEDIVMSANSSQKSAAEQFLEFTQTAEYQINMDKTGQMSVVKSLDAQEAAAVPAVAPYIKQLANAMPRPSVPEASAIDTALSDELTKAFQGTETVQQALTNAAKTIDGLLTQTK